MKKTICLLLAAVLAASAVLLSGCGAAKDLLAGKTPEEMLDAVVATMAAERYKSVTVTTATTVRGERTENVTVTDFARNTDDPAFRIVKTGPVSGIDTRIEYLFSGGVLYTSTRMPNGNDLKTATATTFENAYTIAGKCGEVNFSLLFEGATAEKKDGKYVFTQNVDDEALAKRLGISAMHLTELTMTVENDGFCSSVTLRMAGAGASAESTYVFSRLPQGLRIAPPENAEEYEKMD